MRWRGGSKFCEDLRRSEISGLPILEDANSIQVGLAEVMRLLVMQEIDHRTAALLLYALQTASANQKHTSFEPEPTRVVIDRECVERRPIGATAWSKVEGREYDELTEGDLTRVKHKDEDEERNQASGSGRSQPETPGNERLLPDESERYVRAQKQRGIEPDASLIANGI